MSINFCSHYRGIRVTSDILKCISKYRTTFQRVRYSKSCEYILSHKPRHLICFKQWTARMVIDVLLSAINLKCLLGNSHNKKLRIIPNTNVMILQEVNEPMLNMAVSKAASILGAKDVNIIDDLVWGYDYNGRIFSDMTDIIFVATKTHMCIQRFANMSKVPVLCMKSRTHASIQSLATIMSIMEEYGTMQGVNVAYIGPPHPVLNSYLLLCPMLGANIMFTCSCTDTPVSPLLLKASEEMTSKSSTISKQCAMTAEALCNACVVIAGPTPQNKEKIPVFKLTCREIDSHTCFRWLFYHTCPRGEEVDDNLFWNCNAKTFNAFQNMQYIAAALMAYSVRDYKF